MKREPRVIDPRNQLRAVEMLWQIGLKPGDRTGWPSVDRLYTVVPGQLTIITGWPGSGKSEWLDALLVNLARQAWTFAIFSPENQPTVLHLAKIMEKISGRPFGHGPTDRIPEEAIAEYLDEIAQAFGIIVAESKDALTVQDILTLADGYFLNQPAGKKMGLVIDPWNEIEHWRPRELSETEYVSMTLSTIRGWARANHTHVWIVAHPQKLPRVDGKLPVPRPDSISGSQHWWNKADNCITIWRDPDKPESQEVGVNVQKIRFKHVGRIGAATLLWDRITGRYHEPAPKLSRVSGDD